MRTRISRHARFSAALLGPALVLATPAVAFGGSELGRVPTASDSGSSPAAACTKTISGPHQGTLTLTGPGTTCLVGADQVGAITVTTGHALSIVDSLVTGSVTSTSSAPFTFCKSSTVRGAIKVSGSGSLVSIGDGGACGPNTIDGAVTLDGNTNGVRLSGNKVAGAVTASANKVATTIESNVIGGMLTCTDNTPAPVNNGKKNTVVGDRVGQTCAAGTF